MFSLDQLQFAQKYPVTQQARQIVKEFNFSLDDVPEEILKRATDILLNALNGKAYGIQIKNSTELLKNEILAFTLAKILLSCIKNNEYYKRFAQSISHNSFSNLLSEKNEVIYDIGSELGLKFTPSFNGNFFAQLKLSDYLSAEFSEPFMKLVNQKLESGNVYLTKNDFARFLSKAIHNKILQGLPLPTEDVPVKLKAIAKEIPSQIKIKQFTAKSFGPLGEVEPDAFPQCMSQIYSDLMEGKNVPHLSRFTIATFCLEIGMKPEQVVQLYKLTPNWNEKITSYQVMRLAGKATGKKINSPGCDKLKEYGLACPDCSFKHPVQSYRKNLKGLKKEKAKA